MTLPVSIIVAVAENGIIGSNGDMPWKLSSDLKRFKKITTGNPVIMGRKTYESIGRPLPQRYNLVISRNGGFRADGVDVVVTPDAALEKAEKWGAENGSKEICILGGGEIYRLFLPIAERIYFTKVLASPVGDTGFPDIDEAVWKLVREELVPAGPKDSNETIFQVYER